MAARIGFIIMAAILVLVPLFAANEYELRLFMLFLIYGLIAVGLNILVGLTGLVSLGQAGFFALGAYAGSLAGIHFGLDLISSAILAAIVAAFFGMVLAYPTVRVRGVYLAVITIAFGIIIENVAIEWQSVTGGTTGLMSIPQPAIFGFPLTGFGFYAVLAIMLFIATALMHNIKSSRYGRAMLAVAQSETAARALGINATAMRLIAFIIAASLAGLAGTFYASLNGYISPDIFTFSDSVRFLLMVILGGAATTFGPVIGAFLLTYLPEYLQQFAVWQKFAYGALLLLVIFYLPRGLAGTAEHLWRSRRKRQTAPAAPSIRPDWAAILGHAESSRGAELVAQGLTVAFGGLKALSSASLRVRPGEIHALIGPNGAGKSTFVNTISGFYTPQEGTCELDGQPLTGRRSDEISRLGLARTFQNTELFTNLSVLENVQVGLEQRNDYGLFAAALALPHRRAIDRSNREKALALLEFAGLTGHAGDDAGSLPFGLQRRLEIARALATGPEILLLDEPAAGLTTQEIDELADTIRAIARLGVSILLIEHHVDLIMAVSDTVTVLDYGRVIASDKPQIVQADPKVQEAYFGTGAMTAEVAGA